MNARPSVGWPQLVMDFHRQIMTQLCRKVVLCPTNNQLKITSRLQNINLFFKQRLSFELRRFKQQRKPLNIKKRFFEPSMACKQRFAGKAAFQRLQYNLHMCSHFHLTRAHHPVDSNTTSITNELNLFLLLDLVLCYYDHFESPAC